MKCHSRDIWPRCCSTVVTERGSVGPTWSGCCLTSFQWSHPHTEIEIALPAAYGDKTQWGPSLPAPQDQSGPRQLMLIGFTGNILFLETKPHVLPNLTSVVWETDCHTMRYILTQKWECPSNLQLTFSKEMSLPHIPISVLSFSDNHDPFLT